ncbi:YwhD family protein [Shouchella hunanensis]|uniref:YwhD family protein n=1 Tax=Shouchella hunanensis TaxID=766894 RepID=A0ABY7W8S9_9BACI|nr:YwhD family protein [Shouchella hunanensis]WDF05103.1 YwhD family protein [Shouchella hunanensis]
MIVDLLNNNNLKKAKKSSNFTILSNDSDATDGHGGYGAGLINLDHMTSLFINIDEQEAFVDMGALHARSAVEKRVKFIPTLEDVPTDGMKRYWLIWITIETKDKKPYYSGVAACYMTVNKGAKRGYKSMPEHVNQMDKALKGKVSVEDMDASSRKVLADFLKGHSEDIWNASSTLQEALKI